MEWRNLDLWTGLNLPDDHPLRRLVVGVLEKAVPVADAQILDDFTLHDSGHAARVAARMWQLMPPATQAGLHPEERALLLLSAYLHDIGMSPNHGLVRSLYRHLRDGTDAPEDGADALRRWMDEHAPDEEIPLIEKEGASPLDRVALLVTHYCRSRHVAWSETWIAAHVTDCDFAPGFREALTKLCASHHWDGAEVVSLDPLPLPGEGARQANLRYMATLLRVADVLEISPDRVPPVIRDHNAISPGSALYWAKDLCSAVTCRQSEARAEVVLAANPDHARVHRAILETCDQFDTELAQAKRHADGGELIAKLTDAPGRYQWPWPLATTRQIHPLRDAYRYIDGSFRPDVPRLLSILAGTDLYGDPLAAIRELLQNAFDAVRWAIAQTVCDGLDADPGLNAEEERANQAAAHRVTLKLEGGGKDPLWLVCTDDGIGMTADQIERRLLVSGSARRPDQCALERRCRAHGFSAELTGQFGIGALSYFMLADRVEITSRSLAGNGGAWTFVTEGIGDFGELRPSSRTAIGTEVRLRLRQKLNRDGGDVPLTDATTVAAAIGTYLLETVIHTPCAVTCPGQDGKPRHARPGWFRPLDWYGKTLFPIVDDPRYLIMDWNDRPQAQKEEWLSRAASRRQAALAGMEWLPQEWIETDETLGITIRVRTALPLFRTSAGPIPLWIDEGDDILPDFRAAVPQGICTTAWRGMQVHDLWKTAETRTNSLGQCWQIVETDLIRWNGATIRAHRTNVSVSATAARTVRDGIKQHLIDRLQQVILLHLAGPFGEWLNAAWGRLPVSVPPDPTMRWLWQARPPAPPSWPMAIRAVELQRGPFRGFSLSTARHDGRDIDVVTEGVSDYWLQQYPPGQLLYCQRDLACLFNERPQARLTRHRPRLLAFAPEWDGIDAILTRSFADDPILFCRRGGALTDLAANPPTILDFRQIEEIHAADRWADISPAQLILTRVRLARQINYLTIPRDLIRQSWATILPGIAALTIWADDFLTTLRPDGSQDSEPYRLPRPADPYWRLDPIESQD
ncbi:MAG: ATP-binding protein [Alphaproteobacteria bacterium]|nr:ATP-binding protein [Alphaproteobacteria bacterium]